MEYWKTGAVKSSRKKINSPSSLFLFLASPLTIHLEDVFAAVPRVADQLPADTRDCSTDETIEQFPVGLADSARAVVGKTLALTSVGNRGPGSSAEPVP